jgi:hypothetical protein
MASLLFTTSPALKLRWSCGGAGASESFRGLGHNTQRWSAYEFGSMYSNEAFYDHSALSNLQQFGIHTNSDPPPRPRSNARAMQDTIQAYIIQSRSIVNHVTPLLPVHPPLQTSLEQASARQT